MKNSVLPRVMAIVFVAAVTIRQAYYMVRGMLYGGGITIWQGLWFAVYVGMLIASAIGNKKFAGGTVAAGAIVSIAINIMNIANGGFRLGYVLAFLPWLLLAVVVLIGSGKNSPTVKNLWFVPFAAYIASAVASYGRTLSMYIQGSSRNSFFQIALMCVFYAGMFAFVAYWACHESALVAAKVTTMQNRAQQDNSLERLMELKKLLDAEIITQEEFEEKKKGILGE